MHIRDDLTYSEVSDGRGPPISLSSELHFLMVAIPYI